MAKWNVHFGLRLTYDVEVEADSYDEAVELATPEFEKTDIRDMDFADTDDDVDAWEI